CRGARRADRVGADVDVRRESRDVAGGRPRLGGADTRARGSAERCASRAPRRALRRREEEAPLAVAGATGDGKRVPFEQRRPARGGSVASVREVGGASIVGVARERSPVGAGLAGLARAGAGGAASRAGPSRGWSHHAWYTRVGAHRPRWLDRA